MAGRDGPRAVAREGPIVCRSRPVDVEPWTALRAFAGPRVAWAPPAGPTIAGCGVVEAVTAEGPDRISAVRSAGEALFSRLEAAPVAGTETPLPPGARPRLVGGFAFHGGHDPAPPWVGFGPARFVLPRIQVARTPDGTWLTAAAAGPDADAEAAEAAIESALGRIRKTPTTPAPPPGVVDVERNPDRNGWRRQVRAALAAIEAGDIEKVVLAGALTARLRGPFRLADVLGRLDAAAGGSYRFAADPGLGATFFGATPERLVSSRGRRVVTEALAGSVGRGGTAAEDERLADVLTGTPRIRHEHSLVAETILAQLEDVAESIDVGDVGVRKLGSVQHLETPISATLPRERHVLELVEALHPTPAVGGLPPEAAQRHIRETEDFDRGWYAGPVGWFDASGDGEFAVGIRSAVAGRETATLFAGNGIVRDSDPDKEWDELQLKYRPILDQLRT